MRKYCPWCIEKLGTLGTSKNVSINFEKRVYKCWRCESAGYLTKRTASQLGVSVYGLSDNGVTSLREDHEDSVERRSRYPPGYVPLYPEREVAHSVVLRPYIKYLGCRGVSLGVAKQFKVGVVLNPPKRYWYTAGSLAFPLKDGRRTGYILRDKTGSYKNSKGLDREASFYNGDLLKKSVDKNLRVYIVEGIFDTLVMEGHAIATLGTSITDFQLDRLVSFGGKVVFACDGEARRVSRMAAKRLRLRGKEDSYWVNVHAGRDPGNLGFAKVGVLPLCGGP